jgi:hypothetical protein
MVSWVVLQCILEKSGKVKVGFPCFYCLLAWLVFYPEDGGDIFLRNVKSSKLHSVTTQKTVLFVVIVVETSDPTS